MSDEGKKVKDAPLTCCTFCKEHALPPSPCGTQEEVITRSMLMALELCQDKHELDRLSKVGLPMCGPCRDKAFIMTCRWQQLVVTKHNFETTRNDLAFTTIEYVRAANGQLPNTPMNRTRLRICEKWKSEYDKEKKVDRTCGAGNEGCASADE